MTSILKIGISRNANCDNTVGFPKSGHMFRNTNFNCLKCCISGSKTDACMLFASFIALHSLPNSRLILKG